MFQAVPSKPQMNCQAREWPTGKMSTEIACTLGTMGVIVFTTYTWVDRNGKWLHYPCDREVTRHTRFACDLKRYTPFIEKRNLILRTAWTEAVNKSVLLLLTRIIVWVPIFSCLFLFLSILFVENSESIFLPYMFSMYTNTAKNKFIKLNKVNVNIKLLRTKKNTEII